MLQTLKYNTIIVHLTDILLATFTQTALKHKRSLLKLISLKPCHARTFKWLKISVVFLNKLVEAKSI